MITLFLIFVVVCLIIGSKKDKHNKAEDAVAISNLPSFTVRAKEMSTFSKFLNLATNKSQLLKTFSYANEIVTIRTEDNAFYTFPLNTLFVDFEKNSGCVCYTLKGNGSKLSFYQTTNISDKEWDAINAVLCLANETRGRDIFSNVSKYLGYTNLALKAIKALS